jgi:molecular chaperone GrpE
MGKNNDDVSAVPGALAAEGQPAENPEREAVAVGADELETLVAERDHAVKEKAELQDRLLRRSAEFENYRRRVDREKSELRDYTTMEVLRQLLPVVDSFERALATSSADAEYAKGTELIFQRFWAELQKLGLEPIQAEGQPFDPNSHHALEMRETSEAPDHTVIAELQKGYTCRGKLLRPALVRVAVAPPSGEKQSEK